jgi:hypothetical protein
LFFISKLSWGVLLFNQILRITHDILKKHVMKRDMSGEGEEESAYILFSAKEFG